MFDTILVANRGEIAVRIMATCREMGIRTVGVYSDVDRHALHVIEADRAVALGGSNPAETYLDIDKIIAAARAEGAQAIHPGYGFLAENAQFARRCEQEGIVFIGPPSDVIRDLGDKTLARRVMHAGGVPVIPGMMEPSSDIRELVQKAEEIGFPVMVKSAKGGGGKGMRVVETPQACAEACEAASRESMNAFGSADIYVEKYLRSPRHVEVQVLADASGKVLHLYERECSIQRRHQKIIEETPSPSLTPPVRRSICEAALAAARAAGYVNAGTVEFLLDEEGGFYFLEVNTRLQVEHPVTEMVTGVDIVRRQIEIAAGMPLDLDQDDIVQRGHAIECRIYAEDPMNSFMPCPGKVVFVQEPKGPGIRVDSCLYPGCTVPMEYDPILAKLVVHAETRDACIQRAMRALREFAVMGVLTPIPFLADVIASEAFRRGETTTDFVDDFIEGWTPDVSGADIVALAAAIHLSLSRERTVDGHVVHTPAEYSPWLSLKGFRP
ncbi:MAG TPA: acetyl-CoA carboxylase biotin carboxylase subunit [Deltaproteobacteria bacterium]|nr:acetyl-CoA carboxylase biotin carboxylase subunit [Deltaproteobacteria bacterium]HPP79498.1 acetyl-CoA carboxylase biotin carboxylase subunit [Deltaproteobacteria bacterium]